MNVNNAKRPSSSGRNMKKKTTILIADDHPLFRGSVRLVLDAIPDFKVVGEAGNGVEAIRLTEEMRPDIVLMDITMPELGGLEVTRQIKAEHPEIAVLILTIHSDEQHALEILEAGASGYLTKSVFGEEIVNAIKGVISGEMVFSPAIGKRLVELAARYPRKPALLPDGERLSTRELQLIKLIASGKSNKEIAAELKLSLRTVKRLLDNIYSILHVSSRTEVVIKGLRMGLVCADDLVLTEE